MINAVIEGYKHRHEEQLVHCFNEISIPAPRIKDAMQYALFPGGKRLRPLLVYLSGELVDAPLSSLDTIAVAIELTHAYSLIHDDLPAMDNDDFRRGKLSCHLAFDEATAILVGDGLQALAIDRLLSHLPTHNAIKIAQVLVRACGPYGMVSGQSLDLSELIKPDIDEIKLRQIHQLKTGQLINACVEMSLLAATNVTDSKILALRDFANLLGLVFQMQDDYLDRYANLKLLGKNRASDTINQKITFASIYSKADLLARINDYYQKANHVLQAFGRKAEAFIEFIDQLQQRSREIA